MKQYTQDVPSNDTHRLHDSGKRSRIETRDASVWMLHSDAEKPHWSDAFKTLVSIHRQTDQFNTRKKDWVHKEEIAYYLCDLELNAKQANEIIRSHWGVENRIHHVRDTRLQEDASKIRCNPSIFAILRSFAMNLFRFNDVENISIGLYENTLNLDRVLAYRGI